MRLDDVLRPQENNRPQTEASNGEPSQDQRSEGRTAIPGDGGETDTLPSTQPIPIHRGSAAPPAGHSLKDDAGEKHRGIREAAAGANGTAPHRTTPSRLPAASSPPPSLPWHFATAPRVKRHLWSEMPPLNQCLSVIGSACLAVALIQVTGPPVSAAVKAAVHPYTAAGKQETCMTNLKAVGIAVAMYSGDHDSRFPPLDYQTPSGERVTWVTLLQRQGLAQNALSCPLKGGSGEKAATLSSFGLNPVLSAGSGSVKSSDLTNPEETLLLADRGDLHDTALLPPFPSWPSLQDKTPYPYNIEARHQQSANVLFADGHVGLQESGHGLQELRSWGGTVVFAQASNRLKVQHPVLAQVQRALAKGDRKAAVKALAANRKASRNALGQVAALWKANTGEESTGGVQNKDLEKWGWHLAELLRDSGQADVEQELNAEQSRRSQVELDRVNNGSWQRHESDYGFGIDFPEGWSVSTSEEDKYRYTYLRSGSPHINVIIEKGLRSKPAPPAGVNWDGMEKSLKKRYDAQYKRLGMEVSRLGSEVANRWTFELKRRSDPRRTKIDIGGFHYWDSYVVACTAPTHDFAKWQPVFERIISSFQFQ